MTWLPWKDAWETALYGEAGFYRRPAGPGAHFRTSVHTSVLFAQAVLRLAERVHSALGQPDDFEIVDLGAGRGELLAAIAPSRFRLTAVDLTPRPDGLAESIRWTSEPPRGITGLVIAHEWLDNIAAEVVECDARGAVREVLVDVETGAERLGDEVHDDWLETWWPLRPGDRAEIGRSRDEAWRDAVSTVDCGVAVAVDYGHLSGGRPRGGTLTGYADGRQVLPVPDGGCDLTAHVAFDSLAAPGSVLADQRAVLHELGVAATRPPRELATRDPSAYLRELSTASQSAELLDPDGLGGFLWLFQPQGMDAAPIAVAGSTGHVDVGRWP